jgi:oxygen-independent coproporphyrinogen-3 oxidase
MSNAIALDVPKALIDRYTQLDSARVSDSQLFPQSGVTSEEYEAHLRRRRDQSPSPISLYIHLPFCPVRCFSCNSATNVIHDPNQIDAYLDNLDRELALITERSGGTRAVAQLHLGGGTPNSLSDTQLVRLMSLIEQHFDLDERTEASLEASPKCASATQLELLYGLGFRRICFGIRDLNSDVQRLIGRAQSLAIIEDVFTLAREAGFETLSTDLVFGLPYQTQRSMERTVRQLIALSPDRISCRSFDYHPERYRHQHAIGAGQVQSLGDKLALFNTIIEGLTAEDYSWIGLDCFVKKDDALYQAQSQRRLGRNWLGYTTRRDTDDVLGLGTSSISDLQDLCVQNHTDIASWESALHKQYMPIRGGVKLSETEQRRRRALTELMCNLEIEDYSPLFNTESRSDVWQSYVEDGLLAIEEDHMRVTPEGRYLLHAFCSEASRSHFHA